MAFSVKYLKTLFLFIFIISLTEACLAADNNKSIIAKLVAGQGSQPEELVLGVHFEMQPGWHIYWKNPGDSGLPTKIKFKRAGEELKSELTWPKHQEFLQGNLKTNGYEKEVVLSVKIPKDGADEISADVSWLGCNHDLCVPGKAKLNASLKELLAQNSDLTRWLKN